MSSSSSNTRRRVAALAAALAVVAPGTSYAATWISPRTTPTVSELVTVDATGEPLWIFGTEDVAGDGATFGPAEQALDIRTAYAANDSTRFWVRAYVSDINAPSANVVVYVFIDADQNATTGGSAAAASIDARFTLDPSGGGYEHVLAVRGDGTLVGLWHYNAGAQAFQSENLNPNEAVAEAGTDVDPILLGASTHGYLQASINQGKVGVTSSCQARLYFRSLDAGGSNVSDLDVGNASPCVAIDANADGVPDVLVPPNGCTTDDQCPFYGICVDGRCVTGRPCDGPADCGADEVCDNGRCVAAPGGPCESTADCNGLVCQNGNCTACAPGGTECGDGARCGPDGRCTDGSSGSAGGMDVGPGDRIQGGPCACSWARDPDSERLAALGLVALACAALRRRGRSTDAGARRQ